MDYKITKAITVKRFIDNHGNVLDFVPINDAPGYSHRVYINGEKLFKGWLGDNVKPNKKSAEFFFDGYYGKRDA